ncbi:phage portal protein [Psychrobacillus sp. FSL K6-1415]|uniref:phage portal protein n=1 Tax=Psychrobacillus sp. FSL K6-1415 TaxID=2921544 RepID=UPI0030F8B096
MENGRGYDPKDERMANNSNQMNIQSMYSDIDLDANEIETEFQASFEELLWFVNINLANTNQGDYESEEVNVIFSLIF